MPGMDLRPALLAQRLTARPTEDLDFFTAAEHGHVRARWHACPVIQADWFAGQSVPLARNAWTPQVSFTTWVTRRLTATLARARAVRRSTSNSRVIHVTMASRAAVMASLRFSLKPKVTFPLGVVAWIVRNGGSA